jgi:hypothetical protein
MSADYFEADSAALHAYRRSHDGGAYHALALNIAVSAWSCRVPQIDASWVRRRVLRLLDARGAAA